MITPSSPLASSIFFFLMIRRPPRSPLFPYPPLFRSNRDPRARGLDLLPRGLELGAGAAARRQHGLAPGGRIHPDRLDRLQDRKSTRLNSSHSQISYAVFCLKKKTEKMRNSIARFRLT